MAQPQPAAEHLLVGLGNPGPQYADTRHNLGFMVVERVAHRCGVAGWKQACRSLVAEAVLGGQRIVLAKPQTYMNRSGRALATLVERCEVELSRIVVVHDDLDLSFGRLRVREGGGHGGHNGIRSIIETLGSGEFVRLKIGIGRPSGSGDAAQYVLSPFDPDEEAVLSSLLDRAADTAESIVVEGPLRAMNRSHT